MRTIIEKLGKKIKITMKLFFSSNTLLNDTNVAQVKFFVYSFFLFILVSIPLFIIFYDSFNLNAVIMATYNLNFGLNPYKYGGFLVAGFMIFPYYLFINLLYTLTNYDVWITVIIAKILASFITFFSAILVYRIAILKNNRFSRSLFLAFLFNPFIFFVNDVWVQPEFIAVFFLMLALYILIKNQSNILWKDSILLMTFLMIAGWVYYFPFLLVPAFLFYSKNIRQFFMMLVSAIIVLLPGLLLVFYFHLTIGVVSAVTSNSIIPSVYSIFSIIGLSSHALVEAGRGTFILTLISALLFAIIGKIEKIPLPLTLLIILSITFVIQINELNADSYVVLIPFILLSSMDTINNFTYFKSLLLQTFLFAQFAIVQIYNGPNGLASGIFYWLYPFYQYNITLANDIPRIYLVHSILLVFFLASLSYVIFFFVRNKKMEELNNVSVVKRERESSSIKAYPVIYNNRRRERRTLFYVLLITFIFLFVNFSTFQIPTGSTIKSYDNLPNELFMPVMSNGYSTYIQQSPGLYSYYSTNNTLFFWPQLVGIGLSRNVTSQNLNMSGTFFVKEEPKQLTSPSVIIKTNNLVGGVGAGILIQNNTKQVTPSFISNITSKILPAGYYLGLELLHNSPIKAYAYSNKSYAQYQLNYSVIAGKSLMFGALVTQPAKRQTILWKMQIDNITYESFIVGSSLISGYYSDSMWHLYNSATLVKLGVWFVVGITFNKNGSVTSFVNQNQLTFPSLDSLPRQIELNTGMFSDTTNFTAFSFSGIETAIFLLPSVSKYVHFFSYIENKKANSTVISGIENTSNIKIIFGETTLGKVMMTIGNTSVILPENVNYINFGSISFSQLSIGYHFTSIVLSGKSTGTNFLVLTVEDSMIYPLFVILYIYEVNRKTLKICWPHK